jgi:hypothetical protein
MGDFMSEAAHPAFHHDCDLLMHSITQRMPSTNMQDSMFERVTIAYTVANEDHASWLCLLYALQVKLH